MSQSYLFQASIGPVQSFIASARRTRDLWFGSWMLSELSRAAAQAVVDNPKDLIFPANLQAENVANKIVARINQEPRQVGEKVKAAVRERLNTIWEEAHKQIKDELIDAQAVKQQIDALVECVWAAVPLDDNYHDARARLEALLAARKTTRDFGPAIWGRELPKSSITGQLESVIPEDRYLTYKDTDKQKENKIIALWQNYGAGQAERLSAVDLLKRHGKKPDQDRFLSTSHVAALPFLVRFDDLRSGELARLWKNYYDQLPSHIRERERVAAEFARPSFFNCCDGALLYTERLTDDIDNRDQLSQIQQALATFLAAVKQQLNLTRPSPYYAILHADGDGMGAVIDHEAAKGEEQHQKISQQLDSFATDAANIVRQHQGAPIYTGGDDVLALLPLHTALQCAKQLADRFKDLLKEFTDKEKEGRSPTLSVGLAVVHHLTPLSDALDLARDAEKAAKKIDGKNALAIIVSKRSGGETTVCGQWGSFNAQLEKIIELHREGEIAKGAAYELRDLAERMRDALPAEALRLEAQRILKRKQISEAALQQLQDIFKVYLPENTKHPDQKLASVADMLITARVFADAM
ncbi:MAG: type III-B CRISPR-associated protein Cas10/Cmr2 [Oscillochloris sp.]|nr:type III-B CRISPR-associated protein Cas10/Cmr2 [Oscillochloris sp.]